MSLGEDKKKKLKWTNASGPATFRWFTLGKSPYLENGDTVMIKLSQYKHLKGGFLEEAKLGALQKRVTHR